MRIAYRARKYTSKDWCIRNCLYMNGLQYNILEYLGFYWNGGWWWRFSSAYGERRK